MTVWHDFIIPRAVPPTLMTCSNGDVVIYDYGDENQSMLAKKAAKREAGCRRFGYRTVPSEELGRGPASAGTAR